MPKKGFYFDRSNQYLENDCDQQEDNNRGRKWGHHSKDEHEKKGILSEEVMAYYRQVSTTLENGFDEDSSEAKSEFLTNVFSAIKDECILVSSNQTVSRILEYLFTYGTSKQLRPIFIQFCKELSLVVFDAFSSHVFQALIQYLPIMFVEENEGDVEENSNNNESFSISCLNESTTKLCNFMESHARDIMTHVYGSHVLRSLLEVLGGVPVKADIIRSRMSRNQSYKKVVGHGPKPNSEQSRNFSDKYKTYFQALSQKIIKLCNFEDHLNDRNYCPVLQSVLLILHKLSPDQYEEVAKTILEKTCSLSHYPADNTEGNLPQVVKDEISSHLIELIISLTSDSKFVEMYNMLFKGKLLYYSVHPYANYVLQKLLSCVTNTELMATVLDDISNYIEDILAVNHCGIITKLAEACQKTGVGEKKLIELLMKAFHCYEPDSRQSKFVPLLASFQTYEVFYKKDDPDANTQTILKNVIIHGSLILQQLLQFSKPVAIVNSLLELSQAELLFLSSDKCGSHIVDTFFQSPTVKEKHKETLIKNLQDVFVQMACNRNGSRCLENIWKQCNLQQKVIIAENLCKNLERLEGDFIGKFILRNFALLKFKTRRREWREIQGLNSKKKDLLQDILQGKKNNKNKKEKFKKTVLDDKPQEQSEVSKPSKSNIDGEFVKSKKKKKKHQKQDNNDVETFSLKKSKEIDNDIDNNDTPKKKRKNETADKKFDQDVTPSKKKKKSKKTK